jgi:pyruvate,water dikinase
LDTYPLSGVPAHGASNKLSNLQFLARLAPGLGFHVPPAHVLTGAHFHRALRQVTSGFGDGLLPEALGPRQAARIRQELLVRPLPKETVTALRAIYESFGLASGQPLCVRSCFDFEDHAHQSFAGAFETVPGVEGFDSLCSAVQVVYASVFSERALAELQTLAVDEFPAMSVAIQTMIGGAGWLGGVAHTQSADMSPYPIMLLSVADDAAAVTAGTAIPEDYLVLRDNLDDTDRQVVVQRQAGTATSERFSLSESTVRAIATTMLAVEGEFHYPLEIEWLIDPTGALYLLQARPAPTGRPRQCIGAPANGIQPIAQGLPVGHGAVHGTVAHVTSAAEARRLPPGRILVTDNTDPEWTPVIRQAAAIVTRIGARTSHVARTARESGVLAVVGCGEAVDELQTGTAVTVICSSGLTGAVYPGIVSPGSALEETSAIRVEDVPSAFSLALSCQPAHVSLDLGRMMAALRLPPPGTRREALSHRKQRRIAGYPSVDTFVHTKLVESAALVAVAFPDAEVHLSLPDDSPWLRLLPTAAAACRRQFGAAVSVGGHETLA